MLGSFICRKCVTRTSQVLRRPAWLPRSLHTHAELRNSDSVFGQALNEPSNVTDASPRVMARESPSSATANDMTRTIQYPEIKKFFPVLTETELRGIAGLTPFEHSNEFRAKLFRCKGDFENKSIQEDIRHMYGISVFEARHTAIQLGKLLWGQPAEAAAQRLSLFHSWKMELRRQLAGPHFISQKESHFELRTAEEKVSWWMYDPADESLFRAEWDAIPADSRKQLWPHFVLSAMRSSPDLLSSFLLETFDPAWCPSYVIEDTIYYMFRNIPSSPEFIPRLRNASQLVQDLFSKSKARYLTFDQYVMHKVAISSYLSQLLVIQRTQRDLEQPQHQQTLLHMASRLAKSTEHKLESVAVLRVLSELPRFDINAPVAASICTSLLELKKDADFSNAADPDDLFKSLLELGFRPNQIHLGALMHNFCVRGHLEPAWKIFDLGSQHGIQPDAYDLSILLNAAKNRMDMSSVRKVMEMVVFHGRWTPLIINHLLDLTCRAHQQLLQHGNRRHVKKNQNLWPAMVQIYAKFFHLAPLQKLVIYPLEDDLVQPVRMPTGYPNPAIHLSQALAPLPDHLLMQPDSTTLRLMLAVYMRSTRFSYGTRKNWKWFTHLLNKQDPTIHKLVQDTGAMIFDMYLRAFMQFGPTVPKAVEMLQGMLKEGPERPTYFPASLRPSIASWNIVMNGFKNHSRPTSTLFIFRMMTSAGGVEPNMVSWNILLGSFAWDIPGLVMAVRHMEQKGHTPNERAMKMLESLPQFQREAFVESMAQYRRENVDMRNIEHLVNHTWRHNGNKPIRVSGRAFVSSWRSPKRRGKLLRLMRQRRILQSNQPKGNQLEGRPPIRRLLSFRGVYKRSMGKADFDGLAKPYLSNVPSTA